MFAFHVGYLWGKPGRTAFRLIGLFLTIALLFSAGILESFGIRDWIRFRMPLGYIEEGWRLVRFTVGLFASLHAAMTHMPLQLKYRAYVIGDGIGNPRFIVSRLVSEAGLLALVYLSFCAIYVLLGFVFSIRFELTEVQLERMGWGLLFVFQVASYSALLAYTTHSVLGALPMMALTFFAMELRFLEQINDDILLRMLHRLMVSEAISVNGIIVVNQPMDGFLPLVVVCLGIVMVDCIKDG
jgi:hypothetical protein